MAYKGVERISGKPNVHLYTDTSGTAAYKAGELVRLDASGTLVIATDTDASATNGILGIAMTDSPGSTTTKVPVDVITSDGSTFVMKNSGTSAAEDNGHYFAITMTTTAQTVAKGAGHFIQVGLYDTAGATKGRIIGTFQSSVLQSDAGYA